MTIETADLAAIVAEVRRLEAAATPGPWRACNRDVGVDDDDAAREGAFLGWEVEGPPEPWGRGQFDRGYDAHLIAAMRNALPALLDAIAVLTAAVARMQLVFDAALLLAVTPTTHPLYEERQSDSWVVAFDEARRHGVVCEVSGKEGGL